MTLWEFVAPVDEPAAPVLAGRTLRACHEALDAFEGELPVLGLLKETEQILSLLAKQGRWHSEDSQLLDRMLARSFRRIEELGLAMRPVHGDANLGNLLNTATGPLWTDWEDTFTGPREWDLACLVTRCRVLGEGSEPAEAALAGYVSAVDEEVLAPLVEARALQVAAWLALGSLSISMQASRLEERLAWLRARDRVA
jgi:thiamine kinase-like enzyme